MRLLIAGGGTGGHLFPGVAVAEALRARDPEAAVLFVGTERGIEARVLPGLGWDLATIDASGLKTVGALGALRGLARIPRALWQSRRIIRQFRPDAVLGVGGYASGPTVLAARVMRKPTAILEQNSIPGLTNKILGRVVHAVFLAFDETRQFFAARKIQMSGTPIRAPIRERLLAARRPERAADDAFALFVFGGSQGAQAINELVPSAAAALAAEGRRLSIVHQTGEASLEATRARYAAAGLEADCRAFIDDMASEYARADLVVCRAGAGTVSELAVAGVPAILVPYPFAAYDHQTINARELAERGAALLRPQAELTAASFAADLRSLMDDSAALGRMRDAMRQSAKPQAADDIVAWLAAQR